MINGVINVNKPKGKTSHDIVYVIRRLSGVRRVGHTGTLDPDASGVLPVCIGSATKAAAYLTDGAKRYLAQMICGQATDTQDVSGRVLAESGQLVTEEQLLDMAKRFTGEIEQVPPMYSAVKVNGKKLYELARQGKEVERRARAVTIYAMKLRSFDAEGQTAQWEITCSKGTYIRTLLHDMGEMLGCYAHMGSLVRLQSGQFLLDSSYTLEALDAMAQEGRLHEAVTPVDALFSDCPAVTVEGQREFRVRNGTPVSAEDAAEGQLYRIYAKNGEFLCVSACENGMLKMRTAFWSQG